MDEQELLELLRQAAMMTRRPRWEEGEGAMPPGGGAPLLEPMSPGCGGRGPGFGGPGRGPGMSPHKERERVLGLLDETEGVGQRKLALILGIRPQSLSELLAKLERDGLVERKKNDDDRRETLVCLTAEGKTRAAAFEQQRCCRAEKFLAPLSQEERQTLAALLTKLIAAAQPEQA